MSEQPILRARAAGTVTAEESFQELYSLYKRPVYAWLAMRVGSADADDLAQDAWSIFLRRWRTWRFPPEMDAEDARPVLSFLFRTCHLLVTGFLRARSKDSALDLETVVSAPAATDAWFSELQLHSCLAVARKLWTDDEISIVMAKLEGLSGREIARTRGVTEASVDHTYRRAIAKIKEHLRRSRAV